MATSKTIFRSLQAHSTRRQNLRWHSSTPALHKGSCKPCAEVTVEDSSSVTTADLVRPFFDRQEPLVLRRLLETTPKNRKALQNFSSWNYWEDTVDVSTADCQVEIGGNYSQSEIADVPFGEFLSYLRFFEERFGRSASENNNNNESAASSENLMYMAQNDAFPEIMDAIDIPEFCQSLGSGKQYSTMIWIGPYGCVSPLHYDPLDNVLMQYVGRKKVYLCPPDSPVQAGTGGNQKNTSPLDPEQIISRADDGSSNDDSSMISFQEATLSPGDALYIPKKWYHHVRTIETSVSVNTWFR